MVLSRPSEKDLERIRAFRLIDDTFMTVVFQDIECTQLLIRCVLQRDDLEVIRVQTQRELKNLWGRSVRLDILASDRQGVLYNIEVQRDDAGAVHRRARYNSSLLDAHVTEPGEDYEALGETYVIFITENDSFGEGLPLYHIDRVVRETGAPFEDGEHILYVNGRYRGDDPIGALMHDFFCRDPAEMENPVLARNVSYYKEDPKGVEHMCRIAEEIKAEGRAEGLVEGQAKGRAEGLMEGQVKGRRETQIQNIRRLMKVKNLSFEQACDLLALSQDEANGLKAYFLS